MGLRVLITRDYEQMSKVATDHVIAKLNAFKPENISQADYRKLFPTLVPGEHNDC